MIITDCRNKKGGDDLRPFLIAFLPNAALTSDPAYKIMQIQNIAGVS
ncbi:hypothetical protein AC15_4176 [Escherichia coli 2-156-04_S3_C2]|nr:hypothetical protein AC15_4176 [Escherichia coli 2-156-04_S3_C2]